MSVDRVTIGGADILIGDALDCLLTLPAESVQCCVTSPPYYGLRQYVAPGHPQYEKQIGLEARFDCMGWATAELCGECFICRLTSVFAEVRRVLRKDGTCWLNMGDSYANDGKWGGETGGKQSCLDDANRKRVGRDKRVTGFKPKDLMMQPEHLAFALRADGWYVRSRIIWRKLAPMPESVRDRPTKSHEHIWLLSKSERYFYSREEAREPVTQDDRRPTFRGNATVTGNVRVKVPSGWDTKPGAHGTIHRECRTAEPEYTLSGGVEAERVNKALSFCRETKECDVPGQSSRQHRTDREDKEYGGTPAVKRSGNKERKPASARGVPVYDGGRTSGAVAGSIPREGSMRNWRDVWDIGPEPFADAHFATFPTEVPRRAIVAGSRPGDAVLDPFSGSGTTAQVALDLGRRFVGCELNDAYLKLTRARFAGATGGLALHVSRTDEEVACQPI